MAINKLLGQKKSQAQIIVVVLLILLSIAGVGIISTFVFNLVKEGLEGTECFKTTGQLEIKISDGLTSYNPATGVVLVTLQRGAEDFNMTGILITVSNEQSSKSYKILHDGTSEPLGGITMYLGTAVLQLPGAGEKRTYSIAGSGIVGVNKISAAPMIGKNEICSEGVDEKAI